MNMAVIMDGKAVAQELRARVAQRAEALRQEGIVPTLAVVLVGEDPASAIYVRNKHKACSEAGIRSLQILLPEQTSEAQLLAEIKKLNDDPEVNGILVQLPLPSHIRESVVIKAL